MPHDSAAIEMCKLGRDATCEVPFRLVRKSGMTRDLLDEMFDVLSGENTDSARNLNK
jgi:hypothetical protein